MGWHLVSCKELGSFDLKIYTRLIPSLPEVHLARSVCVDWEPLVRVDHHTKEARISLIRIFERVDFYDNVGGYLHR